MKKDSKDFIKFYLKRQTTDKKLAYLLGILDTYCDLTSKGMRDVSLLMPFWTTNKHVQHFPMIKKITQAYNLQVFPHPDLTDKKNKYWIYYIYTKGNKKKVEELISLFKMVHENKKKKSLHRKIGKLLGYSREAIIKKYK